MILAELKPRVAQPQKGKYLHSVTQCKEFTFGFNCSACHQPNNEILQGHTEDVAVFSHDTALSLQKCQMF